MAAVAAAANSAPFASTCTASRPPVFATMGDVRSSCRERPASDNELAEAKYTMRSTPQLHPAATASVPMIVATTPPPRVKARTRSAAREMHAASTKPIATRSITVRCLEGGYQRGYLRSFPAADAPDANACHC